MFALNESVIAESLIDTKVGILDRLRDVGISIRIGLCDWLLESAVPVLYDERE